MNAASRLLAGTLLLALLIAAGCAGGSGSSNLVWHDAGGLEDAPQGPGPGSGPREPGKTVTVPQDVLDEMDAFFSRPQFLLAERIEIDASRIPFRAATVPVCDHSYVSEVEVAAPDLKATGFLLRSLSPAPMVDRDFPRVRIYQGLDLVAAREIQARIYSRVQERRPIFLRVVAIGDAVYRDETTGRELRQEAITLSADVVEAAGGYEFRQAVR